MHLITEALIVCVFLVAGGNCQVLMCRCDPNFCGWSQTAYPDTFDWSVLNTSTPTTDTGPDGDQTTGSGWFFYTEASSPRVPGDYAVIKSSTFNPSVTGSRCLQFWYHMYGQHIGSLTALTNTNGVLTSVWSRNLSQVSDATSAVGFNLWREARVNISVATTFVAFNGSIGGSPSGVVFTQPYGDIGLDDIAVYDMNCAQIPSTIGTTSPPGTTTTSPPGTTTSTPATTTTTTVPKTTTSQVITTETVIDDLLLRYNSYAPPDMSNGPITVEFKLWIIDIVDMDLAKGYGTFYVWEDMYWSDDRLVWDAESSGVDYLSLDKDLLWTPDITLYRRKLSGDATRQDKLILNNDGEVNFTPQSERVVPCRASTSEPYNVECFFYYGSWTMGGLHIDLQSLGFETSSFNTVLPYELSHVTVVRNTVAYEGIADPFVFLDYTLALQKLPVL